MKTLLLTAAVALIATQSFAISRLNPLSMSCASARAAVHNQGAVIFRWTSPRGLPLYDRFIRNSRFCDANEYAEWRGIPTRDDRACQVLACRNLDSRPGSGFFIPDYSL
jgi:hypothetical protein